MPKNDETVNPTGALGPESFDGSLRAWAKSKSHFDMSPSRIYLHYLRDILENAEKALQFVQGMRWEDFPKDDKTVFAVIRALEVMGEATKNVPDDVREKYPLNSLWGKIGSK